MEPYPRPDVIWIMATKEKDPLAVAFAKRYAAKRSPEARAAVAANLPAWRKSSTPIERRAIGRRAARTRRLNPKWVKMAPISPEPLQLAAAAIVADADNLSTEELFAQAQALFAGFRAK